MIVKKDNKWLVMDSAGNKVLGTHYSKADAMDQLSAIEISKKRRKEMEESQNLLNNSMNSLTEYYKKLCDDLKIQRMVLEAKVKEEKAKKAHKKGDKKADKDYDGDGKVESGSEEYLGSRSNAIKKAVAKREGKELKESTLNEYLVRAPRDVEWAKKNFYRDLNLPPDVGPEGLYGNNRSMATGYRFYGPGRQNPDESDMDYMPTADELKYLKDMRRKRLDPKGKTLTSGTSSTSNTTNLTPQSDLDAMRKKGEEIGGVPAPKPEDDIDAMRRKAEEVGGVPMPDSGDNLPGMDLTAQTPEQIDAANQAQTGRFGGRPTTGMAQRQPKSMSGTPTASPEAGSMMQPYAGRSPQNDGLRRGSAPRKPRPDSGGSLLDRAQALLQFVTTGDFDARRKAGMPNIQSKAQSKPSLVDRLSVSSTRKPAAPGGSSTSPRFARMQEETDIKRALSAIGGNCGKMIADEKVVNSVSLVEATVRQLEKKNPLREENEGSNLPGDVEKMILPYINPQLQKLIQRHQDAPKLQMEISNSLPNLDTHHSDIKKAMSVMERHGLTNHPLYYSMDAVRLALNDAIGSRASDKDRYFQSLTGRSSLDRGI